MGSKPQSFATTSAFEILGPVMVGPSSSHTAGALRCARVAATLIEGSIKAVRFTLWNSFAHTYRGHGTDRALVAGTLGLDTDDEASPTPSRSRTPRGSPMSSTSPETTPRSTPTRSISTW